MTRKEQFTHQDYNSIQNIVFGWLKEQPTSEMFFYLFKNRLVTAEQIRIINKIPRLKILNEFRQGLRKELVGAIQANINQNKPDISEVIDIMVELGYENINRLQYDVLNKLNLATITKRQLEAVIKLYKD